MFRFLVIYSFIFCLALSAIAASKPYYGVDSFQARIFFSGRVDVVSKNAPSLTKILAQINEQIKFMTGPTKKNVGIRGGYKVTNIQVENGEAGIWKIKYDFSGLAGLSKIYESKVLKLPLIFNTSQAEGLLTNDKRCGVPHGFDFWYHWQPSFDCLLRENIDFIWVEAKSMPEGNTKNTFPEYDRLAKSGRVSVQAFFGMEKYSGLDWNPNAADDLGANDYLLFRSILYELGFSIKELSIDEVKKIVSPQNGHLPYIEIAELKAKSALISVKIIFSDTGFYHRSRAFHHLYKEALESSSVILYQGHSGLGKNINLNKIEAARGFKINLPQDRYQIVAQLSCRPYTYYHQDYFDRKKTDEDPEGTKNLDILGYIEEGQFSAGALLAANVVKAIVLHFNGKKTMSYKKIFSKYAPTNGLVEVTGDEDNPTSSD